MIFSWRRHLKFILSWGRPSEIYFLPGEGPSNFFYGFPTAPTPRSLMVVPLPSQLFPWCVLGQVHGHVPPVCAVPPFWHVVQEITGGEKEPAVVTSCWGAAVELSVAESTYLIHIVKKIFSKDMFYILLLYLDSLLTFCWLMTYLWMSIFLKVLRGYW